MASENVAGHAPANKAGGMRVPGHAPSTALAKPDESATAKTNVEKALSTAAVGPVTGPVGTGKAGALIESTPVIAAAHGDPTTKATPSTYHPPEATHTKEQGGKKHQKKAMVGKVANFQPGNHSGKNTHE
jgi:hypothetical protein